MKYDKILTRDDNCADSAKHMKDAFLHNDFESESSEILTPKIEKCGHSRVFWAGLLVEHILLFFALFTIIKTFVPSPTNLNYQMLTKDNKTFPSGPVSWSHHLEALPCGKTPEEARERGCEFDMLVTAWLPPRCIDRELVDEFMAVGNWDFFTRRHGRDEEKFHTYDPDFLGSVNRTIWTTRSWHTTHCLFMFKKLSRAVVNGWPVDGEAVSEPHTEHCMKTFIDQVLFGPSLDPDERNTYLEIIYPSC